MSVLTLASVSSLSSGEVRRGVRCQRCKVTAFVLQMTKTPGQLSDPAQVLLAAMTAEAAGHTDTGRMSGRSQEAFSDSGYWPWGLSL